MQVILPYSLAVISFYDRFIFHPFQFIRNILFGFIPLSIGDIFYVVAFLAIIATIVRLVYFLVKVKTHGKYIFLTLLHSIMYLALAYLIFFIGWGGNYYKPSITAYWDLDRTKWTTDSALINFDEYLVNKINFYAPYYTEASFNDVEKSARTYYKQYTDSRTKLQGLNTKASIFGYLMQHLAIQGYYNPFTGEAQVNRFLPPFMLPFVVAHEMAHQAGVAAEDDANLLAYALSVETPDKNFNYSAYFNIWLYTNSRLRSVDSNLAKSFKARLNPLSQSHIDTLRAIRRRYNGEVSNYSSQLYDEYLKLHNQKEGINSYNKVAATAWAWEQWRINKPYSVLRIP
jgi:hypothetical protein